MHSQPMKNSAGDFGDWKPCENTTCDNCQSANVRYRVWESSCGGFEDCNFRCESCHQSWWIDGIDA
jgi:hypothetical protein